MAIATESEWDSDPELKAMRREFVESFAGRKQAIEALFPVLRQGNSPVQGQFEEALKKVVAIAHKLAGAAETYGFPTLTAAGAGLEDWHSRPEVRDPREGLVYAELLVELLVQASALGKDPAAMASDPRLKKLRAAAQDVKG